MTQNEQATTLQYAPTQRPRLRPAAVLGVHLLITLIYASLYSNILWLMPMLVRLNFGADDPAWRNWQTTLVTGIVPTLLMGSIFWAELLRRVRLEVYLTVYWLLSAVPLLLIAFAHNYWQFFACHAVTAAGLAGWPPLFGKMIKHLYADSVRGRVFAILTMASLGGGGAAVYFVGSWIEENPNAFRLFWPTVASAQIVSLALLVWLARATKMADERAAGVGTVRQRIFRPLLHMGGVLRADRVFLRYELAFMTYGAAFMFCDALLPVLATDRLALRYEDYAHSTQMAALASRLVVVLPIGWLMDRIGAVRVSGLSFGLLLLYPLALLFASGTDGLAGASIVWGVGLGGVMMGWTLGPVALAPSPALVPQYSAIHASLVGIRGVLFQSLGMLLYQVSGSFALPLGLAAAAFLWAAVQMWQLHGVMRRERDSQLARDDAPPHAPEAEA